MSDFSAKMPCLGLYLAKNNAQIATWVVKMGQKWNAKFLSDRLRVAVFKILSGMSVSVARMQMHVTGICRSMVLWQLV
jgi:hypothetical protein